MELFKSYFFRYWRWWGVLFVLLAILLCCYYFFIAPPNKFPSGDIVIIKHGSAQFVAEELSDLNIISSPILLEFILRASGGSDNIQSGAYRFKNPINLFSVAYRIVIGEYGIPLSRITFFEGITMKEASVRVAEIFPEISESDFLLASNSYDGYLFPDTYFFILTTDAETIVKKMRENFNAKIETLSEEIRKSGHSLSDIIVMASLIEKEVNTDVDRHIVSGILWNRINIGMPLQVDAAPDTYLYKGLPPVPICNPGLESIEAVLNPTKTNYLYYLTGNDGLTHYATTFAGHQANLKKYLK